MGGSKGFEMRRPAATCVLFCTLAAVLFFACGCGEQLTRMEDNQVKLQAMVAANARELATLSSQIHTGNAKLGAGLQNLDVQAQGIAAEVQTVQGNQQQLRETMVAGHQGLEAKATGLQEGQQSLQAQVTGVQDTADRTASDLTALAAHHAELQETVQVNQQESNSRLAAVVANQQGIQAGITRLGKADEGLARDVASVAGKQDALSAAMQDNDRQVSEKLASLVEGHEKLATDTAALAADQTALHDALRTDTQTLSEKLAILERNLKDQQTGIDRVFATANQTATVIAAMATAQTAMQESLDGNHEVLTTQIAALSNKADKTAADSSEAIASLQESLRVSRDVVTGQLAAGLQNQQTIQTSLVEIGGKADGLAANLAAVSTEQAAARETSQANQDAIITAMAGLSEGHQTLRTGIDGIDGKVDRNHGALAALTAEQKTQGETVQANHEAVVARLTGLSQSDADLQARINTLNDKADAMGTELSAAAQRQSSLQQALATHATIAAENQQNLQTGIADLSASTQQVSTDLTALATAQDNFRRMQQNHNETMTTRTAGLADGQQGLRGQMDTLTAATNQTALSMVTLNNGQATFQQAMQAGMNGLHQRADQTADDVRGMAERQAAFQDGIKASNDSLTAQVTAVAENQQALKADLGKAANVIDRAYADLTGVALAQETLQSTLTQRSDEISGQVARVEGNQKVLADNLDVVTATTGQTAVDVFGLAGGQADLQQTIKTGSDALLTRTTALARNQETLDNRLDILTATTGQTSADILALGSDQSKLAQAVDSGLAGLNDRTDRIAANQEKTQAGVEVLTASAGQAALDLIEVANRQNALQKSLQSHNESATAQMTSLAESHGRTQSRVDALAATADQTASHVAEVAQGQDALRKSMQDYAQTADSQMAALAANQQKIQGGVDTLTATTAQTAVDVMQVANRQNSLQESIQGYAEATDGRMAKLGADQQNLQSSVDSLTATAGQTALDVKDVTKRQDALGESLQGYAKTTDSQLATVAANQQKMQGGVDTLTATTAQTALDVIGMTDRQEVLRRAMQDHSDSVAGQMTKLAQNQQKMQSGMDTLTATAGQTALDVIEVANRQGALSKAIQSHEEVSGSRMAKLSEIQQKMQTSLDGVATTTGQTAGNVVSLSEAQANSEKAAQAGRTEVAGTLTEIAQAQQDWLQRFDTAEARIQSMAEGITALDQQLVKLQGSLQTGIQNTTTLVNSSDQQRQQFESRIAQDVQAMIDAIAQLRQAQAQLQEQVSQVHKSTQNQAETLKATLEQMKQPPAEVKVSNAGKPVEPAVMETGE